MKERSSDGEGQGREEGGGRGWGGEQALCLRNATGKISCGEEKQRLDLGGREGGRGKINTLP